ncbi:uncharacterized beta-barrel protein YwiB (DUF1934 family) [Bacillus ectoiniformans]|uniref:DUF1934 domain-containing protein n=1 Tax=Bacillus ectoiniformans TaxID=1494429 RepID=UPI001EF77EE8|nr:DUF1934 domain-containing protein [Bacillus ectoiniformans]MBM7648323.1 uncharacterized beta-barrel protein YwiB (DUF1934 family) [Bacillus ectoiniformans]
MATDQPSHIPVSIHLKTTVEHEGEKESFELSLIGTFIQKNQSYFLKYDEIQEEGTIHTIVKFSEGQALILRSGAVKMRLAFNLEEQLNGSYESQYGTLLLTTDTQKLVSSRTYNQSLLEGSFDLNYHLMMQGSPVGRYSMSIRFLENKEE